MQLKELLGYGLIRERNDNMCEYVISSFSAVEHLLTLLKTFIKLKSNILIKALEIINLKKQVSNLDDFLGLCQLVDNTAEDIFGKKRSINFMYVKSKISKNYIEKE